MNFLLAQILEKWNAVLQKNSNNLKLINALISGISVDRLLSYSRWSEGHWIYNINTLVKCCESLAIVVLKYWLYCVIDSAPMTFFFCKLLSPDVTCMGFFAWKRVYEFSWKFSNSDSDNLAYFGKLKVFKIIEVGSFPYVKLVSWYLGIEFARFLFPCSVFGDLISRLCGISISHHASQDAGWFLPALGRYIFVYKYLFHWATWF